MVLNYFSLYVSRKSSQVIMVRLTTTAVLLILPLSITTLIPDFMNIEEGKQQQQQTYHFAYATSSASPSEPQSSEDINHYDGSVQLKPILNDPRLKVENLSDGLDFPTSMAFLGP